MDNKLDNDLVQHQYTCQCGKTYNYLSGLCKHKKKCNGSVKNDTQQTHEKPNEIFVSSFAVGLYIFL